MVYYEYRLRQRACIARLFWVWGVYAMAMCWLWNGLTAAGFSSGAVWALAGVAGVLVLLATREM